MLQASRRLKGIGAVKNGVSEGGDRTYDLVLPSPPPFHCSSLPLLRRLPASNTTPRAHSLIHGKNLWKKDLTDNDKRAIVVSRQNGLTMMTLAGMFGVTEACISQFLKRQKAQDGSTKSQRTGRPRVTDLNDDRNILKTSRTNPRLTALAIRREVFLNSPTPPSVSTVKRRLNAAGIMGRRPVKKPLISEKNRAARVKWAKEHLNWTRQDWNKILWSDETVLHQVSQGRRNLFFVGPQNLVPVLTGPVEMLLRPLHPGGSILENQRTSSLIQQRFERRFAIGWQIRKLPSDTSAWFDVFKMFLSSIRDISALAARNHLDAENARLTPMPASSVDDDPTMAL
ncbi:unnamed protein product [Caenorhabditis auriculariae]|uniref:Transposase Tc1-like domain-containing protein n=1 Tax=Caenorhabditis auriculariae TaxID=2777116 RepID=A0A8S1HR34_9PELO|nr:unnamed protein product [Caenorhabditis auriculariae]